jgi:hypothetical protein
LGWGLKSQDYARWQYIIIAISAPSHRNMERFVSRNDIKCIICAIISHGCIKN